MEKIIRNTALLDRLTIGKGNYTAMAIWPFIFIKEGLNAYREKKIINHERIHHEQQKELLLLPFYILYVLFFVFNYLKYGTKSKAYRNIPFEKEAYNNDLDFSYLPTRKRYMSWIKEITIRKK